MTYSHMGRFTGSAPWPTPNDKRDFPYGSDTYDPYASLFVAQGQRPDHVHDLRVDALPPLLRCLIATDGTVTKFIETDRLERIEVNHVGGSEGRLTSDNPWLEAAEGQRVRSRRIVLRGGRTGIPYVYAETDTLPDRLPRDVREALRTTGEGIGRVLRACKTPTYRELLWYGSVAREDMLPEGRHLVVDDTLARTYRILAEGKPTMLITEYFLDSITNAGY